MLILVMLLLVVVFVVVIVVVASVGGIHYPLLGGTCSTMRTKIVVVVNYTTKDISKLVSILLLFFCNVFACFCLFRE